MLPGDAESCYVTAFPAGARMLDISSVAHASFNYGSSTVVPLGAGNAVDLFTFSSVGLVGDLIGVMGSTGGGLDPSPPRRIFDSRSGSILAANTTREIAVPGARDGDVLVANVTAIGGSTGGFVQIFRYGDTPITSSANFPASEYPFTFETLVSIRGSLCGGALRPSAAGPR